MHRLHELRLLRLRPTPVHERTAKVILLQTRRVARLERLQKLEQPTRPAA